MIILYHKKIPKNATCKNRSDYCKKWYIACRFSFTRVLISHCTPLRRNGSFMRIPYPCAFLSALSDASAPASCSGRQLLFRVIPQDPRFSYGSPTALQCHIPIGYHIASPVSFLKKEGIPQVIDMLLLEIDILFFLMSTSRGAYHIRLFGHPLIFHNIKKELLPSF